MLGDVCSLPDVDMSTELLGLTAMGSTPRSVICDELHLEVLQNLRDNSWLLVERKGKPNIVPYIHEEFATLCHTQGTKKCGNTIG